MIDRTSRRRVLACFGTGLAVGLAGCSGGGEETTGDGSETESEDSFDTDTPDETSTGTSEESTTDGPDEVAVNTGPVTGELFRLRDLDPATTTVEFGAEFDISVVVGNISETEQSGTVTLISDGISYSQDVTIDAGSSQTVTFAAVTSTTLGEGTHTFSISIGEAAVEGQVTVESPDSGE